MVAIQHEIGVANAVQLDRWHTHWAFNRRLHPRPTHLIAIITRQELAVEIAVAADTADDCVKRHFLQPAAATDIALELMLDLVERKKPTWPADQIANDGIKIRLLPRAPKIVDRG